ncbi:MAG: hypothetical protein M4579_004280 [Chaenotheca gracillima]|nr:MAG: hypothetical protein M4579_004280 [Chaenotheca gracillima]
MGSPFLSPPTSIPPARALQLSQQAPIILRQNTSSLPTSLPFSLLSNESQDDWTIFENLLLSCLRTRDDESARQCLEKLCARFGDSNERVMGLKGMYEEAVAENDTALEAILDDYEDVLEKDPTNASISKRRIALLRSMGRPNEAISALVEHLDASPTDAEAWSELSDLYFSQSMFAQSIFSLEEVLLIVPNAWNIHARLGEITYASALSISSNQTAVAENERGPLTDCVRSFSRSIELCDDYLRGYYGLKLSTSRLLNLKPSSSTAPARTSIAPRELEKLNELATSKLATIVRKSSAGEKGWTGYDRGEVIAARELLDRLNLGAKVVF